MTLVVEDGTAKSDANCFCTLEFANAWHLARGITLWATDMSDAEKEAAIIRAAHYIQQWYRMRWMGYRKTTTQALDWPRFEVERRDGPYIYGYATNWYNDDVVPVEVQQANAELAFKAAFGDLLADHERLVKKEQIDVLSTEYFEGSSPSVKYVSVEKLLAPFLKDAGGASISMERA